MMSAGHGTPAAAPAHNLEGDTRARLTLPGATVSADVAWTQIEAEARRQGLTPTPLPDAPQIAAWETPGWRLAVYIGDDAETWPRKRQQAMEDAVERLATRADVSPGEMLRRVVAQPDPIPATGPAIWDLVIADMEHEHATADLRRLVIADMRARDLLGQAHYKGVRLQAFNGRDSLRDAYEEALDGAAYLRQAMSEGKPVAALYAQALAMVKALRLVIAQRETSPAC